MQKVFFNYKQAVRPKVAWKVALNSGKNKTTNED